MTRTCTSPIFRTLVVLLLAAGSGEPSIQPEPMTLTLGEAVRIALDTHPSVCAAQAKENASMAEVGQQRSGYFPLVFSQASVTRFQEPMIVAPLHSFDLGNLPEFDKTLIQGRMGFSYALFDGGARRSRVTGAQAKAGEATAGRTSAELALTSLVTRAYLEVLSANGVLDAQQRRTDSLNAERHRVELLMAEGRAARVELLRVDASLAKAEAEAVAIGARLQLAERELARLVGISAERARVEELSEVGLADPAPPAEWALWLGYAKKASPELESALRRLESAEANRRLAGAAWIPKVDASGAYLGFTSGGGGGSAEWQAGLSVTYPLFTGGARSSAVSAADANLDKAREELRLVELQVEKEVDRAFTAAVEARALVEAVAKGAQHQTEVVRIEQVLLEAGAGTQTDYLRAVADLAQARSAVVELAHAEVGAWVELARVSGVLSLDWLGQNLEVISGQE
jgi:outer membrane protein